MKVEGLTKTYPGVTEPLQILRGIDLTIYKGEIIAIVGQSGSGKSTLLHILGTIDRPTIGSVRAERNVGDDAESPRPLFRANAIMWDRSMRVTLTTPSAHPFFVGPPASVGSAT